MSAPSKPPRRVSRRAEANAAIESPRRCVGGAYAQTGPPSMRGGQRAGRPLLWLGVGVIPTPERPAMAEAQIAEATLEAAIEWLRFTHPVSEHFAAQVRRTDLSGKRLAGWMHLLPDTILTVMPFVEAG